MLPMTVAQTIPSVISSTRASTTSHTVSGASTMGKPMSATL